MSRLSERSSVVLPQPEGPISASTSPWRTGSETALTAASRRVGRSSVARSPCDACELRSAIERRAAVQRPGAATPSRLGAGRGRRRLAAGASCAATPIGGGGRASSLASSCAKLRRVGLMRSMSRPFPRAGDDVDGEVEGEHDQQQHEGGRVGLLGRVALAGGRVVVDVAGQRAAGARAGSSSGEAPPPGSKLQRCAEQDDDDRGVADDPAHAERRPGGDPADARPAAGSAADRRDLGPCRARRRPRGRGGGSRCSALAGGCRRSAAARSATSSRRRRRRSGRRRRPLGVRLRKPSALLEKISRPKIARTMVGVPAIDLDRRLDGPGQGRAGGRTRSARPRSPTPTGGAIAVPITASDQGAEERVEEAAGFALVEARPAGWRDQHRGCRYWSPWNSM